MHKQEKYDWRYVYNVYADIEIRLLTWFISSRAAEFLEKCPELLSTRRHTLLIEYYRERGHSSGTNREI